MRYYALLTVFVLAVLVPCTALSVLALRAAEREAMYVERRMEASLLAEVDLTSSGINRLMADVTESLMLDALDGLGGSPLVGVRFTLYGGRLNLSSSVDEASIFRDKFEGFLMRGERLPTYELVTRVYKTSDASALATGARYEDARAVSPSERRQSQSGITRQRNSALLETDPYAEDIMLEQAEYEGFETYSRNVTPQKLSAPYQSQNAAPAPPLARMFDTEAVQIEPLQMDSPRVFRSRTVSKYRSFSELTSEASHGLVPNLTDYGLELLFWVKIGEGQYTGCRVRMDVLRDMIADTMPDVISDARILTVLDDAGDPIVVPGEASDAFDWLRPFVAREISPLLPRWEVGAWLSDPDSLESRANFARLSAWTQVAVLGLVILVGSVVVMRMMSYEMRVASQKTTFVANVSHELKTPLTSIRLYAELLASGKQTDESRRREYLLTMVSEAERLSNLVDNVLTFSRRNKETDLKSETVFLADLALETVSQVEPHLEKLGFSVTCEAADSKTEKLPVNGNREALKQVLVNLLSNAEKYSAASREISVVFGQTENLATVSVLDRGIGVPKSMSEKIFHEFVRGNDSLSAPAGGAGLGLSIARGIAREHGGDVTFSPRDGGGSIFTLALPFDHRGDHRS